MRYALQLMPPSSLLPGITWTVGMSLFQEVIYEVSITSNIQHYLKTFRNNLNNISNKFKTNCIHVSHNVNNIENQFQTQFLTCLNTLQTRLKQFQTVSNTYTLRQLSRNPGCCVMHVSCASSIFPSTMLVVRQHLDSSAVSMITQFPHWHLKYKLANIVYNCYFVKFMLLCL